MHVSILTLFPESIQPYLQASILGRAQTKGLLQVDLINPRDFTDNPHKKVDDSPYGGGSGMVLACQPVVSAWRSLTPTPTKTLLTSPAGKPFHHQQAMAFSEEAHLVILCGHYEGFDERIMTLIPAIEPVSIGDFVLTGGELPALCIVDALARHLPGVVKEADSVTNDSFYDGLLDYPHYTRPAVVEGQAIPAVLQSGNHARIAQWRRLQSIGRTWQMRPDLLTTASLSRQDQQWLAQLEAGLSVADIWPDDT